MSFEEKLSAALTLLDSTGIRRNRYAPRLFWLLWRLGVKLPPPYFISFAGNLVLMGTSFGVMWGAGMWAFAWLVHQPVPLIIACGAAVFTGLLFGLWMAGYCCYSARKYRIPLWKDVQPTTHSGSL